MTEELFEQAQDAIGNVRDAEYNLERLSHYNIDRVCILKIGSHDTNGTTVYLETELAKQVVKLVGDYLEKKKAKCQKEFDAL